MKREFNIEDGFGEICARLEQAVMQKGHVLVAIDGKCGAGKSTLASRLQEKFQANVFHMDDFFLQPHQRTKERMLETGGNVDYERFKIEVLDLLKRKENIYYQRFSCQKQQKEDAVMIPYHQINIIEGAYSMHPFFSSPYDLKIYLDIDEEIQLQRIMKRNGKAQYERFVNEWIPKENAYLDKYLIRERCNIVIKVDK